MSDSPFINDRGEEELPYVDGTRFAPATAEPEPVHLQAHFARQRALLEDKIKTLTQKAKPEQDPDRFDHAMFTPDENFEIALAMWRESALQAARDRSIADEDENTVLLASEEKSAERRKAAAELASWNTRLTSNESAIAAEADKQRVLYMVNKARPVSP